MVEPVKLQDAFPGACILDSYRPEATIILFPGLAQNFLATLPTSSISLVVTSPPYNLGKKYERRVSIETYIDEYRPVIAELCRVLEDSGSICWQVGNYVKAGEVYPLDIFFYPIFKELGLRLRNRIVWRFGHGLHSSSRFSGRYETILWLTKGDKYTFNLDQVRVKAKYPGKLHSKGPNKGKPSGNPKGKNPSDVWDLLSNDWEDAFWDIPNVKSNHREKTIHPCQFPVELVERCVLALTNEGDRVLDPYAGVGSSMVAAIKHNRRAIGCEKELQYADIAKSRIRDLLSGTLPLRPIGQPLHEPKETDRVAQVPTAWRMCESTIYYASKETAAAAESSLR